MEGFSFVTSVTGLNRPNTGKENDDDEYSTTCFGHFGGRSIPFCYLSFQS
jgi:hypothetical protein